MTSRNLNQTWRDVVFNQYAADHADDVPFPVRYLIHASPWNMDIFIEIPAKIDVVCTGHGFFPPPSFSPRRSVAPWSASVTAGLHCSSHSWL
jgi:hypothetical protein